ncbi:unnamed protein product [Rhizopus microsporus]
MAEKRAIREAQEAAERREAERIRRKAGKEISAAKEELQAKEIKQAFEMKKKEKELDRIAKAKVKAQIEADKRERAAKREAAKQSQAESAPAPAATSTSQPAVKKEYNDARLQIRIPGMSPVTNTFSATSTLSEVYSFLQSQGCTNPFTLSTTFPRKTFGEEDKEKTLKELNLVPSAALILAFI